MPASRCTRASAGLTGVDLNRAGTPLIEIVSEPHLRSAKEAVAYLKKIHTLVRYLGICDGNMQEGSFRCDANVSVRPRGTDKLGTRAEIKNLNSFRFVEKAINYEVARQIELLEGGGKVVQETRLYDSDAARRARCAARKRRTTTATSPIRTCCRWRSISSTSMRWRATLPELPDQKAQRFMTEYGLSAYDAGVLTASAELADYFEVVVRDLRRPCQARGQHGHGRAVGSAQSRRARDRRQPRQRRHSLAALLQRVVDNTISGKIAKEVLEAMWDEGREADAIIEARGPEADHRRVGDRARDRCRAWRPIRRSWPTTAPARTSCSDSSSAR